MNFDTFVSEELCPEDYQTLLPYFKMRYSHTCEKYSCQQFLCGRIIITLAISGMPMANLDHGC